MLREFVQLNHYKFAKKATDWRDAIRMCCEPLEADGSVEADYKEQIIASIEKFGPYIVIMPDVAMPHCQEGAHGVHRTTISFMKLDEPVSFEEGNPEKNAKLFFTLASCDSDQHLENMMKLSEVLMNEAVVEKLMEADGPEDLLRIQETCLDH
ncbi:MAG: PTS sugar transporter subunit IIA [Lachnospiraceae bacterium]|nr:PTS sugar transporter subunit IIA [Lachnospiraceae bacterium]